MTTESPMLGIASKSSRALSKKDFESGQEVRWCPGCGDYAILAAIQKLLPELGIPKEKHVFISGIGCSSRFPYYMNTFGFHTIHGRAPAIATGFRIARPDLTTWVITGDGDALSIGGNHFMHVMRRNVDINLLLFNNRIYGLTKGQYSPTSEFGKVTKSTPFGSLEQPVEPISLALAAGASFVARASAIDAPQLTDVLRAAAEHRGTSCVEIFQNCNVFNDGAFDAFADRKVRDEQQVRLQHGAPMVFGAKNDKAIIFDNFTASIRQLSPAEDLSLLPVYDQENLEMAFALARLPFPQFPVPMGIFFKSERPVYEDLVNQQVEAARKKAGSADLQSLLQAGDTWEL